MITDQHALLFTDIVDSTKHVERLGDAAASELWAEHDRTARDLLAGHGGREIDRTDGFFAIFDSVRDAAGFATCYHAALSALGLAARVGIHLGTVSLRENPAAAVARGAKPIEVEGLAKPLAARIMGLADGARTLLSAEAAAQLDARMLPGRVLRAHGHYRFKGISEPVAIVELADANLDGPPPADSEKAYRVCFSDTLWRPVREIAHNLARERDAFVGRAADLRRLADALDGGARLLTVLGPGGIGKTRLVRRYALAWLGDWPGGVAFCDLSEARSLDGVLFAVARAVGVPLDKADPTTQLGHAIADRGRCLVILDNFEQVMPHAEATVGNWLDQAPQACWIVTSRALLHLAGETVFSLDPLDPASDAMQLFEVRARARRSDFNIDDDNRAQVGQIVRMLDGLPLAVELAAARARVLSPQQMLARLQDRFGLLAGARGSTGRQATLRGAIDWSWDLLAPWEQAALTQCAVFEGGFTLHTAEAVLDLTEFPDSPSAIDVVQSLADKSLLRVGWPQHAPTAELAEPLFGMYLSIHEYARQKLEHGSDAAVAAIEGRHGRYFAGLGGEQSVESLHVHGGLSRRHAMAQSIDNLIVACDRAMARGEAGVAADCFIAAWAVFEGQGPYGIAAELGRRVAALEGLAPPHQVRVLLAASQALRNSGRNAAAQPMLERALDIARAAAGHREEARVLLQLAIAAYRDGSTDEAEARFAQALALEQSQGDRAQLATLLANFANLRMEQGRMGEARATYETALALHREVGNRVGEGISLGNLATLLHELGDFEPARAAYDKALAIHRESGNKRQEAMTRANLGQLMLEQGLGEQADAHYRDALTIYRAIGDRRGEGVVMQQIGHLHHSRGERAEARACYDLALHIHREVGNRRFEAGVLGNLGTLLVEQGELQEGWQALAAAEQLLRRLGDVLYLGKLFCAQGKLAADRGDTDRARRALVDARALAEQLGAAPESDLGRQIALLADKLA